MDDRKGCVKNGCINPYFPARRIAEQLVDGEWNTLNQLKREIAKALTSANSAGILVGKRWKEEGKFDR